MYMTPREQLATRPAAGGRYSPVRLPWRGAIIVGGGMLGGLGMLVGVVWFMMSALGGTCGNVLYQDYPAPDQAWKAVVFQRDCGATTRYSTHIAIMAGTDQLTPTTRGNIYVIDGQPHEVAPTVHWANPTTLVIHRARTGTEYRARDAFGGRPRIQVVYDQRP